MRLYGERYYARVARGAVAALIAAAVLAYVLNSLGPAVAVAG